MRWPCSRFTRLFVSGRWGGDPTHVLLGYLFQGGEEVTLPTFVLSRFFTLVGRVALRQLVHLDTFVFTELKRRNQLKEKHENDKKETKTKKKKATRKSLLTSATEASMNRGSVSESLKY